MSELKTDSNVVTLEWKGRSHSVKDTQLSSDIFYRQCEAFLRSMGNCEHFAEGLYEAVEEVNTLFLLFSNFSFVCFLIFFSLYKSVLTQENLFRLGRTIELICSNSKKYEINQPT